VPGPGHPAKPAARPDEACAGYALREQALRYRLAHPGAMVPHPGTSYSDGFERFILDGADGGRAGALLRPGGGPLPLGILQRRLCALTAAHLDNKLGLHTREIDDVDPMKARSGLSSRVQFNL